MSGLVTGFKMHHERDPKEIILEKIGDLSGYNPGPSQVIVGIYIRPEKTSGGIILTATAKNEDKWQGAVGLVLKLGAGAFEDDDVHKFRGFKANIGDWIEYRPSDTEPISINGCLCRRLSDVLVKSVIDHPDRMF
jgi:co-chaperonin GroES (HSP10)